ncbi:hypothetical protein C8J57DRAFT_1517097 [Mycena rebaudengoi]|nr:hypothetical protein C8J57DRAFT_1517097 [Mycena rebaudengoi]
MGLHRTPSTGRGARGLHAKYIAFRSLHSFPGTAWRGVAWRVQREDSGAKYLRVHVLHLHPDLRDGERELVGLAMRACISGAQSVYRRGIRSSRSAGGDRGGVVASLPVVWDVVTDTIRPPDADEGRMDMVRAAGASNSMYVGRQARLIFARPACSTRVSYRPSRRNSSSRCAYGVVVTRRGTNERPGTAGGGCSGGAEHPHRRERGEHHLTIRAKEAEEVVNRGGAGRSSPTRGGITGVHVGLRAFFSVQDCDVWTTSMGERRAPSSWWITAGPAPPYGRR